MNGYRWSSGLSVIVVCNQTVLTIGQLPTVGFRTSQVTVLAYLSFFFFATFKWFAENSIVRDQDLLIHIVPLVSSSVNCDSFMSSQVR